MADVKHTLFLVHGMGVHVPDTWAREVVKKLETVAARYAFFQGKRVAELVNIVPINYDHLVEAALKRWMKSGETFVAFARKQKLVGVPDLDWVGDLAGDDLAFFRERLFDVLIYRFFELERNQIQDQVKLGLGKAIDAQLDVDAQSEFSVLAHSLGTAVAHDALAELGAGKLGTLNNAIGLPNFRFKSIHMIANVSRLLQTDVKAYESLVRPGARGGKGNYCLRYYDYRHELDPITITRRFEPTWSEDFFTARLVRHYRRWDIHAFTHYLDNPRVHVPILNSLTSATAIPRTEYTCAVADHDQFGGDFQLVPTVRAKIGELGALQAQLRENSTVGEMFVTASKMFKVLREILAELKAIQPGFEDKEE